MRQRPFEFTPVVTFIDEELKSEYIAGMHYTVRPGAVYDLLAEKVEGWLEEGKVKPHDSSAKVAVPNSLAPADSAVSGAFSATQPTKGG